MPDSKISQLIETTSLELDDLITVVQGGVNKKITAENAGIVTYAAPAFTSFSLSGVQNLEIGDSINNLRTFSWATSNAANIQADSLSILDITNTLTLIPTPHSITSPETYDFSTYSGGGLQYDVQATNVFRVQAINSKSNSFTRNYSKNWYPASYAGSNINETLNNAQILGLANKFLSATFPTVVNFPGGDLFFWYWIPESFAQPVGFKNNTTGFPIAMEEPAITQSVTNVNGISLNYKGYRSTELLTNPVIVGIY